LVALVALLITMATALAAQQLLMSQLDRQLDAVTGRLRNPSGGIWSPGAPDGGLLRPGQPIGTLAVLYDTDGTPQGGGMLTERGAAGQRGAAAVTDLPDAAVTRLPVPADMSSIVLSGLGHYRVVGFRLLSGDGTYIGPLVVGVPLHEVDETILQLVSLAALLSLLAIVGTVFASRSLVLRSLRPLNRVAATAQQVSQLRLDRGEGALAVRVHPRRQSRRRSDASDKPSTTCSTTSRRRSLPARRQRPKCDNSWLMRHTSYATRLLRFADMPS
jgi:two-component system OmpR family sensor kinase